MKHLDITLGDRWIVVAVPLLSILAIVFPVKQPVVWDGGRWSKWDRQVIDFAEARGYYRFPFPEVGPLDRGFLWEEKQIRASELEDPGIVRHFKVVPNLQRVAFDLFFLFFGGLCAKYLLMGRRRRSVGTADSLQE